MTHKPLRDRVNVISRTILSDDWSVLSKYTVDYERLDGHRDRQQREVYDRGDGAAVLPFDPSRGTVLLVAQFRLPAFLDGDTEPLIEVCAGVLDEDDPDACIRREAVEELGYRLHDLNLAARMYSSPGSVTEKLWCYTANYSAEDRCTEGGGAAAEGEDIQVLELPLDEAFAMIASGEIRDAKTIMLIQHLKLAQA